MVLGIYDPPRSEEGVNGWSLLKIGDICDALEFDYIKYFCGAGTFTLIISRNSVFADKIYVGSFLIKPSDGGAELYDGFIVKNIVYENDTLKITGYDLNGLLLDRVTLYPQEYIDKAIKTGSTEEIVKYYVDYNCVSSADTERNFPKLGIAENLNRGITNDAASPRLECVADVIADILGAQNMGYRIMPIFGDPTVMLKFEVYEAVDRTQNQDENSRVTFSFGLGNITRMKREVGVTADKNTFYCELSSGAVQRYYKKGEAIEDSDETAAEENPDVVEEPVDANAKSGYDRREEYLKLNCELNEIEIYAEHEIADRYRLTDSLEIIAGNPLDYGDVYNVGDIVTVYDRERNVQLDSIISAVEIRHTGTEYSVKITLGDSKPKVLDSYTKKGQATANSVRSSSGVGRQSELDSTSEYFNSYTGDNKNIAGVEGSQCYARAEGYGTKAIAPFAHAGGLFTEASGQASFATGYYNKASGQNAHAEGTNNTAAGDNTHVEGCGNNSGQSSNSHIEGGYNTITTNAPFIHIEGSNNKASSYCAHVEGSNNVESGSINAHISGSQNILNNAPNSSVSGMGNSVAGGTCNFVHGLNLEVNPENNFSVAAFGQFNKNEEGLIFMIGNGTKGRSNAFAVDRDGNIYITGDIYINGVKFN